MYTLYDKSGNCYSVYANFYRTPSEEQPNVIEFFNGGCKSYESIAYANTDNLTLWTKNIDKVCRLED